MFRLFRLRPAAVPAPLLRAMVSAGEMDPNLGIRDRMVQQCARLQRPFDAWATACAAAEEGAMATHCNDRERLDPEPEMAGEQHGVVVHGGSDCGNTAVADYPIDLEVPPADAHCTL